MSSLPSKDGVANLRVLLRRQRHILMELDKAKKEAAKVESLQEEASSAHREIIKVIEGMDCASSGNYGWESRVIWILDELDKQCNT
jgi:hypothetical protein